MNDAQKHGESLLVRGMRDIDPEQMEGLRRIEDSFREVCGRWGFREIRTPAIEHLYLYTSAGILSPDLLAGVYSFLDWDGWSGERVVLRPDSTVAIARHFVERGGHESARLFYMQNVFRFLGGDESRETWQCGAELIGPTEPQGDLELILLAVETLRSLGLADLRVTVTHAGLLRALVDYAEPDAATRNRLYDGIVDGNVSPLEELKDRLPQLSSALEVIFSLQGGSELGENLRVMFEPSVPAMAGPFSALSAATRTLESLGINTEIVPPISRKFEYYTGVVFRLFSNSVDVGGGGRYDSLVRNDSGETWPASGFVLETERLAHQVERLAAQPVLLVRPSDSAPTTFSLALKTVQDAHKAGLRARLATYEDKEQTLDVGGNPAGFLWAGQSADPMDVIRSLSATLGSAQGP